MTTPTPTDLIYRMLENCDMRDDAEWAKEFWIVNSDVTECSGRLSEMDAAWREAVTSLGALAPANWIGDA